MQSALAVLNAEFRSVLRPDRFFDCYCDDCCDKSRALDSALAGDFDPHEISNGTWDWLYTVNGPGYFYLVPLLAAFVDALPAPDLCTNRNESPASIIHDFG